MPGPRGRSMHGGIGIENAAPIGIERSLALMFRQYAKEIRAEIGVKARQRFAERGLDFLACAEEGRAQHDCRDAFGMCLRIGQRQRRAPGAADHHPALDGEFFSDQFHIRDQMRQCVGLAPAFGPAAAAASLIEQHSMEAFGIEQPAVIRLAAAARPAMQIERGDAVLAPDTFDIDLVAVPDRQQFRGERGEGISASQFAGVSIRRHRRAAPTCHRRNCGRGSGRHRKRPRAPPA